MSDSQSPRPDPIPVDLGAVPDELRSRNQWVCWRYKWDSDRDEWTKIPINVGGGGFASSTDPDTWADFGDARDYYENTATDTDGLGFVVSEDDLVVGLDLDDCRDDDTGDVAEWAQDVVESVPTYAEVSPSGTGLRLFGFGFLPGEKTRADIEDSEGHLEMYETGRYLTVTGAKIETAPAEVRQVNEEIAQIHAEHIQDHTEDESDEDGRLDTQSRDETPTPEAGKPGSSDLTDDELVEKAMNADNGHKFRRLWLGDTSGYPSHSEADLALCGMLAFWTGGDRRRIDRLFRQSDLYRDKWDRDDYRKRTIDEALSGRTDFYDPDGNGSKDHSERPDTPGDSLDIEELDELPLTPSEVAAWAGLDDDEDVSDLSDRQKAACVWELVYRHNTFHVRVRRDTGELWSYEDGVWQPEGERALRHAAREALGSMNYGQNVLVELKAQARSDPRVEVEADEFGLETGTIAVQNGVLDLDAAAEGAGMDALRDLRPEDYALVQLPVEFDPDAEYDEWATLVEEWAEDGRADALQEYVGYCLHVGSMPIHRALLLVGSGANGKGTFLSVVRTLLGRENTSSVELQTLANEKDAVAEFYGSLANIDDDLSARKLGQGLGMFKKLVGGDRVRARRLYEDGFEFDATGKHLYAANEVPDVNVPDDDEAFWRRWLLVEFPNHYPPGQRDPTLRDRLTEDAVLSGVLNWAIEGRRRLFEEGESGHFTNEEVYPQSKRERWQAWGDSIDRFVSECVERDEDATNRSTTEVHRVYSQWCRDEGEKPASQQKLTAELKSGDYDYGQSVRPGGNGTPTRGFKSLGLTDAAPDLDDTPDRDEGQTSL